MDVLGDAAKHRVVVVSDDGDPHAEARASIPASASWHSRRESASSATVGEHSGYTVGAMPIYEYLCEAGHRFDRLQSFSDEPLQDCEVCGKAVHRVLHAPAVHFKGKGFYATDYGRGGKGEGRQGEAGVVGGRVEGVLGQLVQWRLEVVGLEVVRLQELRAQELEPRELVVVEGVRQQQLQARRLSSRSAPRSRAQVQPAANVSPGRAATGADMPSTARITRRFSSPPINSLAPPTDVIVPPRWQCSVRRDAHLAPAELEDVVGGEIGRQRLADRAPDTREVEERLGRGEGACDRLQDALLAEAARDVVVGRVRRVLAHARIGERVAAVELQLAAPEAPRVSVEAVRDDLLGIVERHAAERVDEVAEAREVDQ